ncbi:MAG: hypothetical protein K6T83_15040 [Alicyclobacillus sp.]|nr:hypothetical protein [Alicyclobacillus sp.]
MFAVLRWVLRLLPPMRGLNFITLFIFAGYVAMSVHYWSLPMSSPELPELARHTPGRWYFFLGMTGMFAFTALVYTGMFWAGLAKLAIRTVNFAARLVLYSAAWSVRGLVWAVRAAARGVRSGVCKAREVRRRRWIARMPKGQTIDVEAEWVDDEHCGARCA